MGSMQAEVPPQMMLIDAVGAIAILHEKRSITPWSAASGHGPRSTANCIEASCAWAAICLKILRFQLFAIAPSKDSPRARWKVWKPITPWHTERRSEEHTSELQSLMRISYAVFCLKKQMNKNDKGPAQTTTSAT